MPSGTQPLTKNPPGPHYTFRKLSQILKILIFYQKSIIEVLTKLDFHVNILQVQP
jgi:hypothetical protein